MFKTRDHHAPSSIQAPDGQWPDLMASDWRSTKEQVNAPTLDPKGSNEPAVNGPTNFFPHPSKSDPILLLFIYLFCLFNLFVLFYLTNFLTNNKILFFINTN